MLNSLSIILNLNNYIPNNSMLGFDLLINNDRKHAFSMYSCLCFIGISLYVGWYA